MRNSLFTTILCFFVLIAKGQNTWPFRDANNSIIRGNATGVVGEFRSNGVNARFHGGVDFTSPLTGNSGKAVFSMHAGTAFVVYSASNCLNSYIRVRLQDGSDVYYKHIKPSSTNPVTNQSTTEISNNNGQGTPVQIGTFLGKMFGNLPGEGGCTIHVHVNQNTTSESLQGSTNFINRFVNPFTDTERPSFMYPFGGGGTATDNTSANGYKIAEFRMNGHSKTNPTNQLGESESINGTIYKYAYGKIDIVTRLKDVNIGTDGGSIDGNSGVNAASYAIINSAGVAVGQEVENLNFNTIPLNERGNYVFDNRSDKSNHVYIITNNPTATSGRYDQFWNTNLRIGQTEDWDLTNRGNRDARSIEEAYYPDGKYSVRIRAKDITNFEGNVEATVRDVPVIIDNFLPYVAQIEIRKNTSLGSLVYRGKWEWNNGQLTLKKDPLYSLGSTDKIWIKITTSEPTQNVRINIPLADGTNYYSYQPPPFISPYSTEIVPNKNNTEFVFVRNPIASTNDHTLNIMAEDLAGNSLQSEPSQIPIRQAVGTWSPEGSPGRDSKHQFKTGNGACGGGSFPGGRVDTETNANATTTSGCMYVDFTASKIAPVLNEPITFTPTVSGSGLITYEWNFGSGATPAVSTSGGAQTVVYSTSGIKNVSLKICDVTTSCTTTTKTGIINVGASPGQLAVDFTASQLGASTGQGIQLASVVSGAVGSVSYSWTFDNGAQGYSADANPIVTYSSPGNKSISLTVTDALGSTNKVKNSYLYITSNAINLSVSILGGCVVTGADRIASFSATGFGGNGPPYSNFKWDFGDGTTSTLATPSHPYKKSGKYTVRVTLCDATGCSTAESINCVTVPNVVDGFTYQADFLVNNLAFGMIYSAINVSLNTPVTYTNATRGINPSDLTYSWDFESHYNGGTTESAYPATASSLGPHEVYFTTEGYKESTLVTATTGSGAPGRRTINNVVFVKKGLGSGRCYANIGTPTISNSCWSPTNFPQFTVPTSKTNCPIAKTEVIYWRNGIGTVLPNNKLDFVAMNEPIPQFPITADLSFTVYQYDGINYNRIGYKKMTFTINGPVTADAGPDKQICVASSSLLGTTSLSNISYQWTSANPAALTFLNSLSAANPIFTPTQKGIYTYSLKNTDKISGCTSATDNITLTVDRPEVASSSYSLGIGETSIITTAVSGGFASIGYSWNPSNKLSNGSIVNPIYSSATEGNDNYLLTATDQNGCKRAGAIYVNVSDAAGDIKVWAASLSRIAVTWKDRSTIETGYKIQRSSGDNSNFADYAVLPPNSTFFDDTNVRTDVTYFYRIITLFSSASKASLEYFAKIGDLSLFSKLQNNYPLYGAFADFDGDLDLDVVNNKTVRINNNGKFDAFVTLTANGIIACDYDNDGDMDIYSPSTVFQNSNLAFNAFTTGVVASSNIDAKYIDVDNDANVDLAFAFQGGGGTRNNVFLHQRTGQNNFTLVSPNNIGDYSGAGTLGELLKIADFNNDGKQDIIKGVAGSPSLRVHTNVGPLYSYFNYNAYSTIYTNCCAVGDLDIGDINNDGKIDIVATGYTNSSSESETAILLNSGNLSFQNVGSGTIKRRGNSASIKLGDMDGDGDLDLLLAGYLGQAQSNPLNEIYLNNGGSFSLYYQSVPSNVQEFFYDWVDLDNDGDLDVVTTGNNVYVNNLGSNKYKPNTKATSPTNLCAYINGNMLTMSWSRSTDAETPSTGLSYNVYVKQNGNLVMSPLADLTTGYRKVAQRGNVDQNASWTISLPTAGGTIEWGVQAIDNQLIGSPFAVSTIPFSATINNRTICSGEKVSLAVTQPGVIPNFSWMIKSITSNISGAVAGSGNILDQTLINTSAIQGVVVYSINQQISGCASNTFDFVATVNPKPGPAIAPSGPTTFCSGGSVRLTAPVGSIYSWSNGSINPFIDVAQSGTFYVTVSNPVGCSQKTAEISVNVKPSPDIYISPTQPISLCSGSSVTLSAWPEFLSTPNSITRINLFNWSYALPSSASPKDEGTTTTSTANGVDFAPNIAFNSMNRNSITVSSSGTYLVTGTSLATGCSTKRSFTVTVYPSTAGIISSGDICTNGYTLLTYSGAAYNSLVWSTGQTSSSITVYNTGTYSLYVNYPSGCTGSGSIYFAACNPGGGDPCLSARSIIPCAIAAKSSDNPMIDDFIEVKETTIFPNPANKQFTVAIPDRAIEDVSVLLIDQSGRSLQLPPIQKGKNYTTVDVPDISNGLYLIQVGNGKSVVRKKIEIMKM